MLSSITNLFLKSQRILAHARKNVSVYATPAWKQPQSSGSVEYKSSAMNTDPVRISEPHYFDPLDSCFQRMDAWYSCYLHGVVSNKAYGSTEFIDQPKPRDVKVDKHWVERAKLSTQLGNTPFDLQMALNPFKLCGASENHHSVGEYNLEWVWI